MRVIGLDVGERRIGVAVSDPLGKTAQPLETIERDSREIERLADLVKELKPRRFVVGLPFLMDGREGTQAERVREFARRLEERLEIPVTLYDERLSTREAEAVLAGAGLDPGEKKDASDRVAAALILGAYLESRPEE